MYTFASDLLHRASATSGFMGSTVPDLARQLAEAADSLLFLMAVISRVDGAWEDGPRSRIHGLVDRLSGSSSLRLRIPPDASDEGPPP
ncbi:hypothetical protein PV762_22615 [Mitsuaria sp. CC2]|uniref:hypothetical protein n=1 Tax=Mitsuaria sp. CC2 TaxID=3029186 RepID=UPI003B8B86EA